MELDTTTYYSILGLTPGATVTEISKSYKKLARKFHPDKCSDQDTEDLFKIIVEAYSVLSDTAEKLKYDVALHRQVPQNQTYKNDIYKNKFQNRKSKPYEEQPYGFGFEQDSTSTNTKQNTTNGYKSFNLKSFKRNQQRQNEHHMDANDESRSKRNTGDVSSNLNTNGDSKTENRNSNSQNFQNTESGSNINFHEHQPLHEERVDVNQSTGNNEDQNYNHQKENNIESSDDEDHEPLQKTKLHKSETRNKNDCLNNNRTFTNSTNWEFNHRRYVKNRNENKNSFFKNTTSSINDVKSNIFDMKDDWNDSIRELIDKMNNIDRAKSTSFEINNHYVNGNDNSNKDNVDSDSENNNGSKRKPHESSLSFNMDNINDSINDIPMNKKMKIDNSLYDPVNQTLPRIYKNETIAVDKFEIDSEILQTSTPIPPNFNINFLDALALENCKQDVIRYNQEVSKLKQLLVTRYTKRVIFNMNHMEPLVKLENQTHWIQSCQYDIALIAQLQQLENEQIMVALQWQSMSRENVPSI